MIVPNVIGVILGGGQGTRLQPLTRSRSKPAVPLGGKYRLVDIPISNCINSYIRQILLLTQFNSVSLHDHVSSTYQFDHFHDQHNFIRILAAQQTPDLELWYQGTADAVRRNLNYILDEKPDYVIILSGDQLYRMDFQEVLKEHIANKAQLTICTKPVKRQEASELGIMKINQDRRIVEFLEKPGPTADIHDFRSPLYEEDEQFLASMGIYIFNMSVLREVLQVKDHKDFGKNIIPNAIPNYNVYSYIFDSYWKDIGTIGSFWEANLALTEVVPPFSFYDMKAPIYTHMRYLPPSKINCCDITCCLLSDGCIISGHRLLNTIIGIRQLIGEGTVAEYSILMGADYYEIDAASDDIPIGIGRDCYIKNAIIDKNVRIGDGVYISPEGKKDGEENDKYVVRDGIIVIPKGTRIPSGTRL
ncbi:MAG TPA: glucose-1-phosphate adenylyltransferase [Planctomycetota bacterium]|nr:glucose-1-phosphate adenylyltransferase [Planctomycetota bacterium]HRU51037.1 glucose-1-phosphate adenylyltransferase [Planctomycetota bacterium]